MRGLLFAVAFLLLTVSPAGAAPALPFFDLDFEAPECTSRWQPLSAGSFEIVTDGSVASSGRRSLRLRYTGQAPWTPAQASGGILQQFPAANGAGRSLRLSGSIRTEGVTLGGAGLWWTAFDGNGQLVAAANTRSNGVTGTTGWTRRELVVQLPASAQRIYFGGELFGNGSAWFDGLSIAVNGRTVQDRPDWPPVTRAALSWLRRQAIPFNTVEAGSSFRDLQPLKRLIGNARIVSLGEQTHGTREFFQMKHRLTEFLASEMGFTLFAIEANMPEAYEVNKYVLTGEGDPKELLKGMYFWTWDTQEVLDMIEWMRDFNRSGKGRIQFLGFDMQYAGVAAEVARGFLTKADPESLSQANGALDRAVAVTDRQRPATSEDVAAARWLLQHMQGKRREYLARFPREEVDWAIQNARVCLQGVEDVAGITSRDASMAKNVEWILDQSPGAKIVLWAHNAHASKRAGWMGNFLARRYGKQQVVLGFAFQEGRYNAFGGEPLDLRDWEAPLPHPNSVEILLNAAGIPRFIVDLRRAPAATSAWLKQERHFRLIGSVAERCPFYPSVVGREYDGLIWIDKTSPSELLP